MERLNSVSNQLPLVKKQTELFGMLTTISWRNNMQGQEKKCDEKSNQTTEYGTFKDSLKAPVHRWFKYPAGYSYKLIQEKILQYALKENNWILDPFVGCGTTSIEAKKHYVNSIGIEAHPFISWVAQTKLNWDVDLKDVKNAFCEVIDNSIKRREKNTIFDLPELVHKCYSEENLRSLVAIRNSIEAVAMKNLTRRFLQLALISTLRTASKAATGWPYISPGKLHQKTIERPAFVEFAIQVCRMFDDLELMKRSIERKKTISKIVQADARNRHSDVKDNSIDLAITSPPYLNNYDYADRTRLETYFMGWYSNWRQITKEVRDKLIISATTQIRRQQFENSMDVLSNIKRKDCKLYDELQDKVKTLSELRLTKGGRKSYDHMTVGYFGDMYLVIEQIYRSLKKKSDFVLVLGDSAPYGVYIPTHEYLGRIGLAIGFSSMVIEELRKRGDKWKDNPQRHKVKLKEVILTLTK